MAEDQTPEKTGSLRAKSATVREKVEKHTQNEAKPRRLQKTTRRAAAPFRAIGRFLKKISRFIIPPYFRNSWRELREVTWPKGKVAWQLTLAVIVFAIVFGVVIFVVDFALDKIVKQVFVK